MGNLIKLFVRKTAVTAAPAAVEPEKETGWNLWKSTKNERLQVRIDLLEESVPAEYNAGRCIWCGKKRPVKGTRLCLLCGLDVCTTNDLGFDMILKSVRASAAAAQKGA